MNLIITLLVSAMLMWSHLVLAEDLGIELVDIPAGSFMMGSEDGDSDELPVRKVTIAAFKMMKYEVTWAQYQPCIDEGACGDNTPEGGDNGWGKGHRPVIEVSWDDTQDYIRWVTQKTGMSFRLPTEAEWEYAARAGSTTKYSWGDAIGVNRANCDGCGSPWDNTETAPVGSFQPNDFGLYDMHGNVWEWVADCFHDSYVGAPSNGDAWVSGNCDIRMVRGGSWYRLPAALGATFRNGHVQVSRNPSVGFRLVLSNP